MNVGTERYQTVRLLGQGGMGAVYEVNDTVTGGRLAMKVMLAPNARLLLRFKQEFRIVAEFHHRNLVRLFDLACENDRWFFTMELIEGQSLREALLRDPDEALNGASTVSSNDLIFGSTVSERSLFATDDNGDAASTNPGEDTGSAHPQRRSEPACHLDAFVAVIAQVLDALEFLHARGVVHRDLKPGNILVDIDGVVRVLDFGLASRVDVSTPISAEGTMVGTIAYMSPEQCNGEEATPASDLYSLGCIMFELLTGSLPFPRSIVLAIQTRLSDPAPRVDDRADGVPPAFVDICQRLMQRDPAARPSIDQVRAALGITPRSADSSAVTSALTSEQAIETSQPFVGRQRELDVLHQCLDRAAGGHMQFALLSGTSGIGKSALAARVAARAHRRGFLCFHGRCYERERVPFVAFDRAVDAMILTLATWPRSRLALLDEVLEPLQRLFPAFGLLAPEAQTAAQPHPVPALTTDPRELYHRAFEAFCRLLDQVQSQAPLLLVLDDLHWVNEDSVALLKAVLARVSGRVCVLGTYRPEGIDDRHPMTPLLERMRRSQPQPREDTDIATADANGNAARATPVHLLLGALQPDEIVELVDAVAGQRLDPATSAALASQAEGNPFLTLQMAEHLARTAAGEVLDSSARAQFLGLSVDGLLRGRIEALSEPAEIVLSLAAAAGGDVSTRLLIEAGKLLGALTIKDFELAIGELTALRLCKSLPLGPEPSEPISAESSLPESSPAESSPAESSPAESALAESALAEPSPSDRAADRTSSSPPGPPPLSGERAAGATTDSSACDSQWDRTRVDLYHDRIREAAYDRLDAPRRIQLHRALANTLEARPERGANCAEALLRHWTAAGDRDKRRHYALMAADRAADQFAFRHAARLFRIVLDDPEPDADPLLLATRWEHVGDLCEYSGHLDEASDAYQHALARWETAPETTQGRRDALVRLHGRLGETLFTMGRIAKGRDAYERGLALMGLPLERSHTRRLAMLVWLQCRLTIAKVTSAWSVRRQQARYHSEQIRFLESMMRVFSPSWPIISIEAAIRCELLARRADNKNIVQRATAARAMVLMMSRPATRRHIAHARKILDAAEAMAREHAVPLGLELVQLYSGLIWLATDATRAKQLNEAAQAGLARHGLSDFYDGAIARLLHVFILVFRGDYDAALATIADELHARRSNFLNTTMVLSFKAVILAHRGRYDDVDEVVRQLQRHLRDTPTSGLTLQLELAQSAAGVARGRFADVLAAAERFERESGLFSGLVGGAIAGYWVEHIANAAEGLARRGAFAEHASRRWARQWARWLARRGPFDLRSTGFRVLAVIAHADGQSRAARRALTRALDLSAVNSNPYRRWLCLEAARDLGTMTVELETEAAALETNLGLVLPTGWRKRAVRGAAGS